MTKCACIMKWNLNSRICMSQANLLFYFKLSNKIHKINNAWKKITTCMKFIHLLNYYQHFYLYVEKVPWTFQCLKLIILRQQRIIKCSGHRKIIIILSINLEIIICTCCWDHMWGIGWIHWIWNIILHIGWSFFVASWAVWLDDDKEVEGGKNSSL
jgi:hypothetical protein